MILLAMVGFLITYIQANENLNVNSLLQDIEKKTDLSSKTKLANSGVVFVYTRDDLQRMQLKNLKDILKSVYPLGYTENSYGLADPFYQHSRHPFLSSQIRVFINNQEVTTGLYGSGLIVVGNMDIQWADHIEIYTQSPTYEYATESTATLIKIYTKSVKKDEGGKVITSIGSFGATQVGAYYADYIKDWSYFTYFMVDNNKRKKYTIETQKVSRDTNSKFIIATFNKENQNILLTLLKQKRDTFLDASVDATPTKANLADDYFHIGYDNKIGNWKYLLSYDYGRIKTGMKDDVVPIPIAPYNGKFPIASLDTKSTSEVFSGELTYAYDINKHHITTGVKYRIKKYPFDKAEINGKPALITTNDKQITNTLFLQDAYNLKENSIIAAGVLKSQIRNNNSLQNDDLFMYRLGYTYTTNNLTFQSIFNHSEMSLDPYLINSRSYLATPNKKYKMQNTDGVVENIIYEKNNQRYELMVDYLKVQNYLVVNTQGLLENYSKHLINLGITTRYKLVYNDYNSLFLELSHRRVKNIPRIDTYKINTVILRTVNSYKKFDIFNEILYCRNNLYKRNNYDYSAGIIYHVNNDLSLSLKGTNLLNKAKKQIYYRINPVTFTMETPFEASPIDRKIMFSIEYTF